MLLMFKLDQCHVSVCCVLYSILKLILEFHLVVFVVIPVVVILLLTSPFVLDRVLLPLGPRCFCCSYVCYILVLQCILLSVAMVTIIRLLIGLLNIALLHNTASFCLLHSNKCSFCNTLIYLFTHCQYSLIFKTCSSLSKIGLVGNDDAF